MLYLLAKSISISHHRLVNIEVFYKNLFYQFRIVFFFIDSIFSQDVYKQINTISRWPYQRSLWLFCSEWNLSRLLFLYIQHVLAYIDKNKHIKLVHLIMLNGNSGNVTINIM